MRILISRICKQALHVYLTEYSHHLPVVNDRVAVLLKFDQSKYAVLDNDRQSVFEI